MLFSCPGQPRAASLVGRRTLQVAVWIREIYALSHQMHTHDSPRHNFEKVIMGLTRRHILSELLKDLWALSNNHLSTFKKVFQFISLWLLGSWDLHAI